MFPFIIMEKIRRNTENKRFFNFNLKICEWQLNSWLFFQNNVVVFCVNHFCVNCFEMLNFSQHQKIEKDGMNVNCGEVAKNSMSSTVSVEYFVQDDCDSIRSIVCVPHRQIDGVAMVSYPLADATHLHSSRIAVDCTLEYCTEMAREWIVSMLVALNSPNKQMKKKNIYMIPRFFFIVIILFDRTTWLGLRTWFLCRWCWFRTAIRAHRKHITIKISTWWTFCLVSLQNPNQNETNEIC